MKKIFAIYLCIMCIIPTLVMADCTSRNDPCSTCESRSSCLARGGCSYSNLGNGCNECPSDAYNPVQQNCGDDPDAPDCSHGLCRACESTWTYGPGQTFDTSNTQTGMSECPWTCDTGYFTSNDEQSCIQYPLPHTDTYYTSGTISNSQPQAHINECSCPNYKLIHHQTQHAIHQDTWSQKMANVYVIKIITETTTSIVRNARLEHQLTIT